MVILKIKTPGLYIHFPGITPFRTPAEINITGRRMDKSDLKKYGVMDYEIYEVDPPRSKKKVKNFFGKSRKKENIDSGIITVNNEDILNVIKEQQKTINRIEDFLTNHFSNLDNLSNEKNNVVKKKKVEIDDVDKFIPSIDINKVKTSGSFSRNKVKKIE